MLRHSAERGARTVRAEEQSSGTALSRTLRTAEPSVVAVPYVCEVRSHFFFSSLLTSLLTWKKTRIVNNMIVLMWKKQTSLIMTKIASETKCTIVVVGDSRTGKSALLHRFVHKSFQPVRHVLILLLFKYVVLTIDIFVDNQLLRLDSIVRYFWNALSREFLNFFFVYCQSYIFLFCFFVFWSFPKRNGFIKICKK